MGPQQRLLTKERNEEENRIKSTKTNGKINRITVNRQGNNLADKMRFSGDRMAHTDMPGERVGRMGEANGLAHDDHFLGLRTSRVID